MTFRILRLGLGAAMLAAGTPCPYFVRTAPVILLNDGSNTIRLEVSVGPGVTSVVWKPLAGEPFSVAGQPLCGRNAQTFNLRDDGGGGDLQPGDGIFTLDNIRFDPTASCRAIGLLTPSNGAMAGFSEYNIGAITVTTASGDTNLTIAGGYYTPLAVVEAQMFRVTDAINPIDANAQRTAWIINVRDDALSIERGMGNLGPALSLTTAAINLSRYFDDGYDFRGFISTTTTACDAGRTQGQHIVIQSNVTGNGETITNFSNVYQSGPKLIGITMHANFIIGSTGVVYHETMHQWGAYLNSTQFGLNDANAHWVPGSSVGGALGGCPWVDNGNGTFSIAPRSVVDGDLELYVAGLLPASQVNPVYVTPGAVVGCTAGLALPGPYRKVTIDDIIKVHGPRVPAWDGLTKNYRYGLVVTSQNRLLSPLEMTFYGRIAQLWEGNTVEVGANPPYQWPKFTRGASALTAVLDTYSGPLVRAANITNAASGAVAGVSPGEILVLYGDRIGPQTLTGFTITGNRFDTKSGGTRVLFDGTPAAMLYSSAGQVSAIVPYEVAGRTAVSVQVEYLGQLSPVVSLPVTVASTGIFTQDQSGHGPGSIRNQDFSLNTAANPAKAGTVVQIYGTGEGQTVPGGTDGGITPDLRSTEQTPTVFIGGQQAVIQFAGPAPLSVAGLFQVNAFVPQGLTPGGVPVVVKFGNASSQNGVTVFVQ